MYPYRTGLNQVEDATAQIFRPELYGVPDGITPATDQPLLTQAIAAAAAVGATVRLDQTYAYTASATISVGGWANVTVGLHINSSNVTIDGRGAGTLVLPALPAFGASFIAVLVGNGLYTGGAWPGRDWLEANGNWVQDVALRGVNFDNSALTDANLATLTTVTIGGIIKLSGVDGCTVEDVVVDRAYGHSGAVGSNALSKNLVVQNVDTATTYTRGYFFDGPRDSVFDDLVVDSFLGPNPEGLIIAGNSDYRQMSEDNEVKNCAITGAHQGIGCTGSRNSIHDNAIDLALDAITHLGVTVSALGNVVGTWEAIGNEILDNQVTRAGAGVVKGWGVYLNGNLYDGQELEVAETIIEGNTFSADLSIGLVLGPYASRNVYRYNTVNCGTECYDNSGGTAKNNVLGPNGP